jgi:hypothetical protein
MDAADTKLFAMAIYELRVLLSHLAGPESPYEVRFAWRLAYALHNDAEAAIAGKSFDIEAALNRIAVIDQSLGKGDGKRIADEMRRALSN